LTVHLDIAGHVARVTVDRPAVLNALDAATTAALEAVWQRLEADRDVRAVVLTGAGQRAFCAGADMRSDDAGADGARADNARADNADAKDADAHNAGTNDNVMDNAGTDDARADDLGTANARTNNASTDNASMDNASTVHASADQSRSAARQTDHGTTDKRDAGTRKPEKNRTGLDYWAHAHPTGFGGLSLRTTLDIPIIARVNGHALGGGLEMMLGCDIVVAVTHATFGFTEPRVGRLPIDGGMVLLPRRIGYRAAMGMLLTGRRISATQALAYGLVNEVVPSEELDAAVDRWLADILACAPLSLRAIKQTVRRTAQLAPHEAQALRLPAVVDCLESEDGEEGVRAFLEKRPPVWAGR
jgi:enoyl-CoA hydratase/carnithine racemase